MRRFALVPVLGVLACFSETEDGGSLASSESSTSAASTSAASTSTSVESLDTSSSESGALPCDAGAVADGVFASAASGDDVAGDGTAMRPVATIGVAITIALASEQRTIYLDEGVYTEAVVLPDAPLGLAIEGGWVRVGTQWSIDCSEDVALRTVIAAPPSSSFVVEASGVVHPSALRRMTLATKASGASPDDASGESIYGVRVLGEESVLALEDVVVNAGNGGRGGEASEGIAGALGPAPQNETMCDGHVCDDGSTGSAAAIAGAPAAMSGSFDDVGFVPRDGAPGNDGGEGRAGTASPNGPQSASNCVPGCTCHNNSDCNSDGPDIVLAGELGRCGCGGGGGGGGAAGRGGGATVALFVSGANATVSVTRAQLSSGNGGDGSEPGAGGVGGAGSLGVEGGSTSCFTGCSTGGGPCANCYSSGENVLDGGAAGGVGGTGGSGSAGGAGAGGDAWSVVLVGGAKLIATDDVVFAHGEAGGGAARAPDGRAGDLLELE